MGGFSLIAVINLLTITTNLTALVSLPEVTQAISRQANSKAPGPDMIIVISYLSFLCSNQKVQSVIVTKVTVRNPFITLSSRNPRIF